MFTPMPFDNGQVRIAPGNPQPSRGLGDLSIRTNGRVRRTESERICYARWLDIDITVYN